MLIHSDFFTTNNKYLTCPFNDVFGRAAQFTVVVDSEQNDLVLCDGLQPLKNLGVYLVRPRHPVALTLRAVSFVQKQLVAVRT